MASEYSVEIASAKVIDGSAVSMQIREEIAAEVSKMEETLGVVPGLAVIFFGDGEDDAMYARNKRKACKYVGLNHFEVHLPGDATEEEVVKCISKFNKDPLVHGILIQLPVPSHINEENILNSISIEKDVDGFHPMNLNCLAFKNRKPLFFPCCGRAIIELLCRCEVDIKEKRVVVIGRSITSGLPVALLLQRGDATVTTIHSGTKNPEEITLQADILISAVGKPNLVKGSWIKPGAIVLDVGISHVKVANRHGEAQIVGDVCFQDASRIAAFISPVPGGVGPVTTAMLLSNTLLSAKRFNNINRYYSCPETGPKFYTYEDLMRYVNYAKAAKFSIYSSNFRPIKPRKSRKKASTPEVDQSPVEKSSGSEDSTFKLPSIASLELMEVESPSNTEYRQTICIRENEAGESVFE